VTGKCYYITTLGDWKRRAARFANSHFIMLEPRASDGQLAPENHGELAEKCQASAPGTACCAPTTIKAPSDRDAQILVLIEADEGVHLALEDDTAFEALPHPFAQKAISEGAQAALAGHGLAPGATTFEVAEAVARVHPLMRHRVF